jgi:hypothetical protein
MLLLLPPKEREGLAAASSWGWMEAFDAYTQRVAWTAAHKQQ